MQMPTLQARMSNPIFVVPDAMQALQALGKAIQNGGVLPKTLEFINLRVSQINGCGVCAVQHPASPESLAKQMSGSSPWQPGGRHLTLPRLSALRWRSPRPPPDLATVRTQVPDEIWDEAARYYDERALAAPVIAIANINVWNRLNVTTKQVAGQEW